VNSALIQLHISHHRRWAIIAAVTLGLGGCGVNGDFARPNPILVHDDIHAWMGPAAIAPQAEPLWMPQLTDDERRLRDLAYPLIEPPYDRNQWYSVIGEYGFLTKPRSYPDRAAYASRLLHTAYRSQTARYNKLMEDIRNDVVRLDPFFASAHTVTELDRQRERAMAYIPDAKPGERTKAELRMRENEAIILWVRESLQERAASYRLALERLIIAAPSQLAVEAERQLVLLQQRIAAYTA
jgi:hypothetical protein